jgi:hydroxymethylpyrimidine pyrophosphatase-like HAD family hydrolase
LRGLEGRVREEFEKRGWPLRVSMTWLYINCDLKHVSKGTALDRLITQTGLKKARLAGIGDTAGDRFIAERVSWFGCPGNASQEIRQHADYVAAAREIEGVLEILANIG